MMLRLFFNAETQRRGDAENNPCVSAPLRLCVKNFSFLLPPSSFILSPSSVLLPPSSFLLPPSLLRPLGGRNKAFTLIETALAMLAIGLGLLAIFGLGRLSLQAAKETEHDQRCAMMADAVFETLREYNARFVDEARTNNVPGTWWTQWQAIMDDPPSIPFPPIAGMSASDELFLRFHKPFEPAYKPEEISLTDWNPRYLIRLSGEEYSPISSSVNTIRFELIIYPDGDTYSSEYRLFRTTLTNPGGLP